MESQIIAKKMIKPAVRTPDHLRIFKLTFFDQLAPVDHIPFMQFYKANTGEQGENLQEKLLKSLSETLIRFYPLAGRFIEDGWYIDCNDQGAEYIESKVKIKLHEFLSIAPKNMHLLNLLVARNDLKAIGNLATTPILCLKVSTFSCGGIAICTHLSHKVVDGFTAATFFREWSVTCKSNAVSDQEVAFPPKYSFDKLFPTRDIPSVTKPKPNSSLNFSHEKLVKKTFVFDEEAISTLKSKLAIIGTTRPTRVEAVTSMVLKAIIAATEARKDLMFYCPVNIRGRTNLLKKASDDNSLLCGNYCIPVPIKIKRDGSNTKNLELHDLVHLIRSKIGNVLELCSKTSNPDDLFMEFVGNLTEIVGDMGKEEVDTVFFSSLCRFPFYEADFGWGKPEWVTTGGMTLELAFFKDTKSGTGISAMVCLQEEKMLQFECDPDIVAFTT